MPTARSVHYRGAVSRIINWCSRVIVRNAGPNVSAIILNMSADAPRGELIRITSRGGDVGGADAITAQCSDVAGVKLERAEIVGAVRISHPLAGPPTFLLRNGQQNVGGQAILVRSHKTASNPFISYALSVKRCFAA